jgi:competence protein ComEC
MRHPIPSPRFLVVPLILAACAPRDGAPARAGGSREVDAQVTPAGAPAPSPAADGATLRFARLLPDPRAVPDDAGEWIEIENAGPSGASLDGWRIRSGGDAGFALPRGARLAPGARYTLARSTDRARNGGVDADAALTGITLGNRADWLALVRPDGRTADSVAWNDTRPGVVLDAAPLRAHVAPVAEGTTPPAGGDAALVPPTPTPAAGGAAVRADPATRAPLEVRVLDVGQGDAILIRNGASTALIDGGPDASALGAHLDRLGIGKGATIDLVIMTHPHADHYMGLQELFRSSRKLTVRYFIETGDPSPNRTLARLRDSVGARVRRKETAFRDADDPCANGKPICTFTLRGGAKLHVLRPVPSAQNTNDRSVVTKLVGPDSASFAMWLAGDAEETGIAWFEQAGYAKSPGMKVDVLKADHHGSCNGVTPRYLALTRPALAVASLAAENDYGHMHEQAKSTYTAAKVPWYRTDQNGTITIRTPGTAKGGYTVTVERGVKSMSGPSDRRARCG